MNNAISSDELFIEFKKYLDLPEHVSKFTLVLEPDTIAKIFIEEEIVGDKHNISTIFKEYKLEKL